jgi:hypothetical protein
MLPTLVLCMVLSGAAEDTPSDAALTPVEKPAPAPAMNDDAVKFDELPAAAPHVSDDARVKQFLGAFAGGLVGFGAMIALMPLDQTLVGCIGCVGPFQILLTALAPVVSMTAAWAVHAALGGQGGVLAPYMAFLPAVLVAMVILNIAKDIDPSTTVGHLPFVAAAGFFLAGGSALALDLRGRQLDGLGGSARGWGGADAARVSVVTLVSAATSTIGALLSALLGALNPFLGIAAGFVQSVGVAAAAWGTHKAMHGRGTLGAALGGIGLGGLVTLGSVGLYLLAQSFTSTSTLRSTAGAMMSVEVGVVSAMFAGTLALELSHTMEVQNAMPKFQIGAAPLRDGGMVSAGMRF